VSDTGDLEAAQNSAVVSWRGDSEGAPSLGEDSRSAESITGAAVAREAIATAIDSSTERFDGRDELELSLRRELVSERLAAGKDVEVNKALLTTHSTLPTQSRCNCIRRATHRRAPAMGARSAP